MAKLKRSEAPGELELVREFVNTWDLEDDEDELDSPAALTEWLSAHGLLEPRGASATAADVERATGVREALRALMLANAGGPLDPTAPATLDEAARRARLGVRFGPDGSVELAPAAAGIDAALGRIVSRAVTAMSEGSWPRLKACGDEGCRWAFYDHTKNRSGVWCDMAVCGNRAKARAFRERRSSG